jgi:hypothetical protein
MLMNSIPLLEPLVNPWYNRHLQYTVETPVMARSQPVANRLSTARTGMKTTSARYVMECGFIFISVQKKKRRSSEPAKEIVGKSSSARWLETYKRRKNTQTLIFVIFEIGAAMTN